MVEIISPAHDLPIGVVHAALECDLAAMVLETASGAVFAMLNFFVKDSHRFTSCRGIAVDRHGGIQV